MYFNSVLFRQTVFCKAPCLGRVISALLKFSLLISANMENTPSLACVRQQARFLPILLAGKPVFEVWERWAKQKRQHSPWNTAVQPTRHRQNLEQHFEEAENYALPAWKRLFEDCLEKQPRACRPFRLITAKLLSVITRSSN